MLFAIATISSIVTTADSPASSPIGTSAGTKPGPRIPLNDIVAITYVVVTAITVAARYAKNVDSGTGVTRSAVKVPASTSSSTRKARAHQR